MKVVRAAIRCALLCAVLAVGCGSPTAEGDPDVPDVTPEVTTCPDNLVLWEEYNVCAPRVDDCENPWELPLIGGGCVAIGPRGCPKLWDPEADVDCEPGELMTYNGSACPEGFVLTEDEVACIPFFEENCGDMEIPVLGGGCKRVGPEWREEGESYFDDCEPGHLALPGGGLVTPKPGEAGCVMVGPRACPKLWDPGAEVDCEVGDVLPCPEDWSESEDGMYCHPGYADCPPDERALAGGACERVIPSADDCPAGPFPKLPEGATNVAYVWAGSQCLENCGSKATPYSSIQAAIDAAPQGGHVLVAAGEYNEGLLIGKPLHVVGLCASLVMVDGLVQIPDEDSKIPVAGVAIVDTRHGGLERSHLDERAGSLGIRRNGISCRESHQKGSWMRSICFRFQCETQRERHGSLRDSNRRQRHHGIWCYSD